ncbi:MAG: molybdopterin-guanine dinucleotide biosynthesis protein B [Betaproteobacteria bacterium]|jgi:molybdopterin-guanine dinucleotide biosynthesis protein B
MKIFGFAGYSGSGKTTLIEKLIPIFKSRGYRVSLIKHAHHSFDIDQPGKDSFRHRQAGCDEVLISSSQRWALMHELRGQPEPDLNALLARLTACDLVLVEGFKRDPIAKLEVYRSGVSEGRLGPHDSSIVAVATEPGIDWAPDGLPRLDLNQPQQIADFIENYLSLLTRSSSRFE